MFERNKNKDWLYIGSIGFALVLQAKYASNLHLVYYSQLHWLLIYTEVEEHDQFLIKILAKTFLSSLADF